MKPVLAVLLAAVVLLGSPALLSGVGVLAAVTAISACFTNDLVTVAQIPDSLAATNRDGESVVLDHAQLMHAATIITTGGALDGVGRPGVTVALMAALTESRLRMLSNTTAHPDSAAFPNDGDGGDHDSLGMFQMRPASGWGTVAQLMDPAYQAAAFFGGPTGPNHSSPRGLLDIPGWAGLSYGQAAQAVEVSAYPDRYDLNQPVAEAILAALTVRPAGSPAEPREAGGVPETTRIVMPLSDGQYALSDSYGWRTDPITGERSFHEGFDFAAAAGTPIVAVADGIVVVAAYTGDWGNLVVLEHTINGQKVASAYAHILDGGTHVTVGQSVSAGDWIADVGSTGRSTGAHLHLEIRPGGWGHDTVDPLDWLTAHHAEGVDPARAGLAGCRAGTPR